MTGDSVWQIALLLVLALLPTVVGMAWVAWLALSHSSRLASRGMSMAEEMQRHAWSAEVARDPERASLAASLESITRPQVPEPSVTARPWETTAANPFSDENLMHH